MTESAYLQHIANLRIDPSVPDERIGEYAYLLTACEFPASVTGGEFTGAVATLCRRKLSEIRAELSRRLSDPRALTPTVALTLAYLSPYIRFSPDLSDAMARIASAWTGSDDRAVVMCVLGTIADRRLVKRDPLSRRLSEWLDAKLDTPSADPLLICEVAYLYSRIFKDSRRHREAIQRFEDYLTTQSLSGLTAEKLLRLHALAPLWYDLRRSRRLDLFTRCLQRDIAAELTRRASESPLSILLTLTESLESANYAALLPAS